MDGKLPEDEDTESTLLEETLSSTDELRDELIAILDVVDICGGAASDVVWLEVPWVLEPNESGVLEWFGIVRLEVP